MLALLYTVVRGDKARMGVWGLIAVAWALVLAEQLGRQRERRADRGRRVLARRGVGARRAGLAKKSLRPAAVSADLAGDHVAAGEDLLDPWGVSWLWVAAVMGPVLGLRTLLNPSPRDHK